MLTVKQTPEQKKAWDDYLPAAANHQAALHLKRGMVDRFRERLAWGALKRRFERVCAAVRRLEKVRHAAFKRVEETGELHRLMNPETPWDD